MTLRQLLLSLSSSKLSIHTHNEQKKDRVTVYLYKPPQKWDSPGAKKWVFRYSGEPLDKPTRTLSKEETSLL